MLKIDRVYWDAKLSKVAIKLIANNGDEITEKVYLNPWAALRTAGQIIYYVQQYVNKLLEGKPDGKAQQ